MASLFGALFSGADVHGAPQSSLFAANSKYHAPPAVGAPAAAAAAPSQPAAGAAAAASGGKKQKKRRAEQQQQQEQRQLPPLESDGMMKKKRKERAADKQQQPQVAPAPPQGEEPQQHERRQSKKARKDKGAPAQQQHEQQAAAAAAAAAAAQAAHSGEDAAGKPGKKGKKSKRGVEATAVPPADEQPPKQKKQKKQKGETAAAAAGDEEQPSPQPGAAVGGKPAKQRAAKGETPGKSKVAAEEAEQDDERLPRTVFVGNLPATIKRKAVTRLFARCGAVESVRLRSLPLKQLEEGAKGAKMPRRNAIAAGNIDTSHTANAYVVFEAEQAVEEALKLNMSEFEGHHLRVDRAAPKAAKGAVRFDPSRSLFVGNLPLTADEEPLIQLFGAAGVEAVRVVRDPRTGQGKGVAFVLFRSQEASVAALKAHRKGAMVGGRELRLTVAKRGADGGGKGKAAWQQGSASSAPKGSKKSVSKPVVGKRKAGGKRPAVAARKAAVRKGGGGVKKARQ